MPPDTRQLILDTAIRLFEERGYAGTTMRAIATEAGVSPSNAYYWFASKDQLVQEFYRRIQVAHRERSAEVLAGGGSLTERLLAVEHAGFEVMAPYHGFGVGLRRHRDRPGRRGQPVQRGVGRGPRALDGDLPRRRRGRLPGGPGRSWRPVLPDLLWLAHLSVTLFWVIDTSPGQERTRQLVERSVADARQRHPGGPTPGSLGAGRAGRRGARRRRARAEAVVSATEPADRRS